jgi:hypothetical protein
MRNKWVSSNEAAQAWDSASTWAQGHPMEAVAVGVIGLMIVVTIYTKLKG